MKKSEKVTLYDQKNKIFFDQKKIVFLWKIKNKITCTHGRFSISAAVFEIYKFLYPVSA